MKVKLFSLHYCSNTVDSVIALNVFNDSRVFHLKQASFH